MFDRERFAGRTANIHLPSEVNIVVVPRWDDTNVYVRSEAAGKYVMASLEVFLEKRLRLMVNRTKSAVDRSWKRKLLAYSFTAHREAKLKVSDSSLND